MKQLGQDPNNFIIALARNPDKATQLKPLLGPNVVPLKADIADFDSFPVGGFFITTEYTPRASFDEANLPVCAYIGCRSRDREDRWWQGRSPYQVSLL